MATSGRSRPIARPAESAWALDRTMDPVDDEFIRATITAGIIHDLKIPLQVILGWADVLRRSQSDGGQIERALTVVERNTKLQMALLDHLIEVLRPTWKASSLRRERLNFRELVETEIRAVQPLAREKGIRLVFSAASAELSIEGTDVHLRRVVSNLVSNALKFTPRGGKIECRLGRSRTSVELVVRDSGRGINAVFLPRVFESFRTAPGEGARDINGLGLGLSVVRHLVELHGGVVTAASEGRGCGSTFTVTLPAAASYRPAAHASCIYPRV